MLIGYYKIGQGIIGGGGAKKTPFVIFLCLFLILFFFIDRMYDILWYKNYLPGIIKMGSRRVSLGEYSSVYIFQFITLILLSIYWLQVQSKSFCNRTNLEIFKSTGIPSRKLYLLYFYKRFIDLVIIDSALVSVIFLYFLIFHQAYAYLLFLNSYILFIASSFIILIYDLFHFAFRKAGSVGYMVLFFLMVITFLNEMAHKYFSSNAELEQWEYLLGLIPDVINLMHKYILISFGDIVELSIFFLPLITLTALLGIVVYGSRYFLTRLII